MKRLIKKYHIAKAPEQHEHQGKNGAAQQHVRRERVNITLANHVITVFRFHLSGLQDSPFSGKARSGVGIHSRVCDGYRTYYRETPKQGRNELCRCGSKKKYKFCCIS